MLLMSPRVLETTPEQHLSPSTLARLQRQQLSPCLEGEQLIFIFKGQAQTRSVELAGELTGWHSLRLQFQQGPGQLFYLLAHLPTDARLEYKLLVDGEWTLDPWNNLQVINGLGGSNSVFEMPGYQHDLHRKCRLPAPQGQVDIHQLQGQSIAGRRLLQVYLPPNPDPNAAYPVVYFQDGSDYLNRIPLPQLLNQLIGIGLIPPLVAVCIDPLNRFQEYRFNPAYASLLLNEVLPLIESLYPVRRDPAGRTLVGSSLGGLTSTWLACQHSEVFGQVLGQSSSFQYEAGQLSTSLRQGLPLRFYLSAGRFEGLLQSNRNLVRTLAETGYDYVYREYNEGHNWTHWSNRLSEGLIYLLGKTNDD